MIKNLSAGNGIQITGDFKHIPYMSPGAQHSGQLHVNTNTGEVEMFDGQVWRSISATCDISLNHEVIEIVEWAKKKMLEEKRIQYLLDKHPGLRDTYEKFEIMKSLCLEEEKYATR